MPHCPDSDFLLHTEPPFAKLLGDDSFVKLPCLVRWLKLHIRNLAVSPRERTLTLQWVLVGGRIAREPQSFDSLSDKLGQHGPSKIDWSQQLLPAIVCCSPKKKIFFPSQIMFASDDSPATAFETSFNRGQISIADVFSQLVLSPLLSSSVEMVVSAVETSLQALFKDVLEQYKVMSSANDGRETLYLQAIGCKSAT